MSEERSEDEGGYFVNRIGDAILKHRRLAADKGGTVYLHTGTHWRVIEPLELMQLALHEQGSTRSKARHRNEIVDYIKVMACDPALQWGRVKDHEIPAENGVIDALTGGIRPHDPDDYLDRALPVTYRPVPADALAEACPVWMKTLVSWFGSADAPRALALQEFFGYVILPHAKFKKALICKGPSDCGKSVVPFLASRLVGLEATCSLSVEDMEDPVRRAALKGKALNVLTELPADAMIKDGGFKTLVSTEEPVMIDQKYKPAETYTPTAKHIIATNNLPRINDRTEATVGRFLIVPFDRVFRAEQQDRDLQEKLTKPAELQGILCWAVLGAKRLIERKGVFENPPEALPVLAELREEANPVMLFLREQTYPDKTGAVPLAALASRYNKWQGTRATTPKQLGKMLRAAGQVVKDVRVGARAHNRVLKCLVGAQLVEESAIPDWLAVPEEAATSLEPEVEGSLIPK